MNSVFHRAHAGRFLLDVFVVVVVDVPISWQLQFFIRDPFFSVVHFLFKQDEEVLHGRVVGTRRLSGHALENPVLLQCLHPGPVSVMPALVGVGGCPLSSTIYDDR